MLRSLFGGAVGPPSDASLFPPGRGARAVGRRLHLSLIAEVSQAGRVLGFTCSAWLDDLTGSPATELEPGEREAVKKFLQQRADFAEFLHDYVANKEEMELLQWLNTVESSLEK